MTCQQCSDNKAVLQRLQHLNEKILELLDYEREASIMQVTNRNQRIQELESELESLRHPSRPRIAV